MIRPRQSTTRLGLEALDDRTVPAGNVTAQLLPDISGDLTVLSVVGDNEANEIRVIEDAPGHVRIEGMGSTRVNGMAAVELLSAGDVLAFADIDLGNGDDTLIHEFTGDQFRHDVTINTGQGHDSVTVLVRGTVGNLRLDTGTGNDTATIDLAPASLLNEGLQLDAGEGNDRLFVRANPDGGLPILAELRANLIDMGNGNDIVQFEGTFGTEGLSIHLGNGDDSLIGDPEGELVGATRVRCFGDSGHDILLDTSYFGAALLFDFEMMD